jgi:hypothetical protein
MPIRNCSVCNQLQKFSKEDYGYLDKDGPLVCSVDCVLKWLRDSDVNTIDPLSLEPEDGRHCGIVSMDRPSEVYSTKLRMWFRSYFEKNVAEVLLYKKFKLRYEIFGFTWGMKQYTPDFYSPEFCSFLEVKGKWQASQRSKYADFRDVWPEVRLLVIPWTLEGEFRSLQEGIE